MENATSFTSLFADSSIFGVYGAARADHGGDLVKAIVDELHRMKGEPQPHVGSQLLMMGDVG